MKKKTVAWGLAALTIAGAAAASAYFYKDRSTTVDYQTAPVERGSLAAQVVANGTVNPVTTVLVGSQVSGRIQKLYADYNTPVKEGELIARIDPATFKAQVSQTAAKVQSAQAAISAAAADIGAARSNLEVSRANVLKAEVAVADTLRSLGRNLELYRQNLIAASEKDAAQTAHDSALAQLEAARAQQGASQAQLESTMARLPSAQASLKQAEAEMEIAQLNLDHTRITAPVNGIVISRNVDVGQTVAASLQAPTLFTIAQDLTEMQVEANVSEADIGRVAVGQDTTFTVDAFPQAVFRGKVTDIRNSPLTVQNVVSYIVVVRVKNPEQKLRPGMTANASILVARRNEILKLPNGALRFRPEFAKREKAAGPKSVAVNPSAGATSPGPGSRERVLKELNLTPAQQEAVSKVLAETHAQVQAAAGDSEKIAEIRRESQPRIRALLDEEQQRKYDQMPQKAEAQQTPGPVYRVWVPVASGRPEAVEISTGISDGVYTEVVAGALKEGQAVIIGEVGSQVNAAGRTSPPGLPGFSGRRR